MTPDPPPQALKTKHDTPKYGLIYHAQLVGQSGTKLKGKVCILSTPISFVMMTISGATFPEHSISKKT